VNKIDVSLETNKLLTECGKNMQPTCLKNNRKEIQTFNFSWRALAASVEHVRVRTGPAPAHTGLAPVTGWL